MRFRFLAKWFAIGFAVRLVLAVIVFLLALNNWEAVMLNLADLPTMGGIWLLEQGPGVGDIGGGRFYLTFNLFAATVWGLMFALFASIVNAVRSRRRMRHSVA
jgi:uncharacterized integral membrane protein